MASRHSAARPRRDGERFARTHNNDDDVDSGSKRVRFDVRNPSALAPESREDDAILDADVIGGGNTTKRGAVNLDGYDSDSDNDTFNAKAQGRKAGKVDILEKLDSYETQGNGAAAKEDKAAADDDDDDMFAASDGEDAGGDGGQDDDATDFDKSGKKRKHVQYLDADLIEGQEELGDDDESEDGEVDLDKAIEREGIDDEVGAGGLKRNAPKVEAFNLKEEMEEGRFDESGNYIRRAGDPDAVHDRWLEGTNKKEIKKVAEAHKQREAAARQQRIAEDGVLVPDLLSALITRLEASETALEALARLGKGQTKTKKIPKWKLKKMNKGAEDMDVEKKEEDPEQERIRGAIQAITDAADKLLSRDYEDIYDQERELLMREYRRQAGEDWVDPQATTGPADEEAADKTEGMWEFRWTDGRDGGGVQGPFDGQTMKAWQDAGYFAGGVAFRRAGDADEWKEGISFT